MQICALVTFNLAPAEFWERFVEGLPPQARRAGPLELPAAEPSAGPPIPFAMEITRWEEERAIAFQMRGPWFLREIDLGLSVDSYGLHWTRVRYAARLRSILNGPLRIVYLLARRPAHRLITRELAALRHEIETGQQVTDDNRAVVRLEDIEIVRCNRQFP